MYQHCVPRISFLVHRGFSSRRHDAEILNVFHQQVEIREPRATLEIVRAWPDYVRVLTQQPCLQWMRHGPFRTASAQGCRKGTGVSGRRCEEKLLGDQTDSVGRAQKFSPFSSQELSKFTFLGITKIMCQSPLSKQNNSKYLARGYCARGPVISKNYFTWFWQQPLRWALQSYPVHREKTEVWTS